MKHNRLREGSAALLCVIGLSACQTLSIKETPPSTAGSIAAHKDLTSTFGLKYLVAKTPSMVNVQTSDPVTPDTRLALAQYDELLQLAPDPMTLAEALRRSADLRVQIADAGDDTDGVELNKAIAAYQRILKDVPTYPHNDRVMYQLARAYQLSGDNDRATAQLRELGQSYPDSERTADGMFRAAELLYTKGNYADAATAYATVVAFGPDNHFHDIAQYKYGWALFQQGKYSDALPVFMAVLDRELPKGKLDDTATALSQADGGFASDTLRVVSLSFASLGGGVAINDYLKQVGSEPRYTVLLYDALGRLMLDKQRYSDAAETFTAFIDQHPQHALSPAFQRRAIDAYADGGFTERVIAATERYVDDYAPGAAYWHERTPSEDVLTHVRIDLETLGKHYQAQAQQLASTDDAARKTQFARAAEAYRRLLQWFPQDPQIASINLLYADTLLDSGQILHAAEQYAQTAYGYPDYSGAADAGYASVQTYQRLIAEADRQAGSSKRQPALHQAIDAGLRFAEHFPEHAQRAATLARTAENLFELQDYERAIEIAEQVLQAQPSPASQRSALSVIADARYALQQYPEAETAYLALLQQVDVDDPLRPAMSERLATSIYRQAEVARAAGDQRTAADTFLRIGRLVPFAPIRATADYDAAAALVTLEDWPAVEQTLEGFRQRNPQHELIADVDKKLAVAYQKDNKPARSAEAFLRIAQRTSETADTRRSAAWLAAQQFDASGAVAQAINAFEYYVITFPRPLAPTLDALQRLADMARDDQHDRTRQTRWLQAIVDADRGAGTERSEHSREMAATSLLALGRMHASDAQAIRLSAPIDASLPRRKAETETAIALLDQAAAFGFADVTTAATFELGTVYREFGKALMQSERPRNLSDLEREQYDLLLEEQAYPFEEKAIKAHEANLKRIGQGLWDPWIRRSVSALSELVPAKYGKNEHREMIYESPA
ncbi:tetratricopeptide repeat protein [Sinimarinibacterium sp. CAU 1509]|uniref:tetratricopeptide repeat protein n=1 Tax=Sinimarinibacterium sp. CAU 1509 TaxID=2562283 RepID=UPI0010AC5C7A|nr:tetratricopeptide repeat protein [Sinimarinibacterium sp. CAU 1509]TJY61153.1 tetratricopeptide repeat protein [Sinimarinibacterium sp. CAU 1509]